MTIHVTAEDIATGVRGECMTCPVAIAVNRVTRTWCYVFSDGHIGIHGDQWIEAPREVSMFLQMFDAGLPVTPFTFELDIEP